MKWYAAVLVALVLVLIVVANRAGAAVPLGLPATPTPGFHAYPEAAVDGFMAACHDQGAGVPLCNCLIVRMQQWYTYDQFRGMAAAELATQPDYQRVAQACAGF